MRVKGSLSLSVSPFCRLPHSVQDALNSATNPRRFLLQRRFADILRRPKKAEDLDIRVTGHSMGKQYKVIVRNKAKRYVNVLLLEELRRRGFDSHGQPVLSRKPLSSSSRIEFSHPRTSRSMLRGSVEVLLFGNVLSQRREQLLQQVKNLVDDIVRRCRYQQSPRLLSKS